MLHKLVKTDVAGTLNLLSCRDLDEKIDATLMSVC